MVATGSTFCGPPPQEVKRIAGKRKGITFMRSKIYMNFVISKGVR
jgi:hypothetical protein